MTKRPTTTKLHLLPHHGGAVPSPMGMGRNGRTDLPRGSIERLPPLSWTVFFAGLPVDRTPFQRFLILALLLISFNVHPNPGPIRNNPRPRYPCYICHLDVGRDSLQCTACLKWVYTSTAPPSPMLTFAQSVQLALQWVGIARRAGPPTQTNSLITMLASPPPPPPGFPPLPPGFYQSRPPQGPPRYPCSLCSHEVGKDSLKCSTCSKWVHFSCSSLTPANFRKICAAGSTMGWNCPACLNGNLASPTHQQASPRSVSPVPSPPTPPPPTCSDVMDSSLLLPSRPPLLNTYPLSDFTLPSTPPLPTSSQPINNSTPHP